MSADSEKLNYHIEQIFGGDRDARIRNYNIAGLKDFIKGYQHFKSENDKSLMGFMIKNINE